MPLSRLGNPASRNTTYYLLLTDLPTYLLTYLPTYLLTDLPTDRLTYLPTYLLTYSPAHLLLEVARHRFAREGRTQVLKLLWLNHEGAALLCRDQAGSGLGQLALRRLL